MPLAAVPVPRALLRDDVHARLQEAIVDGSLAPGEQLRDAELAERLGVSRTPVREALLELAQAGLVQATPGRSTVVAPIDPGALRDAQAVVGALHALAVRTATPRMTTRDLDAMRAANAAFRAALSAGDLDGALEADARFHRVALDLCANAAVTAVIARYEPVLRRVERLRFASHEGAASADRHDRLIALCAAGAADDAARLAESAWQSLTISPAPTEQDPS